MERRLESGRVMVYSRSIRRGAWLEVSQKGDLSESESSMSHEAITSRTACFTRCQVTIVMGALHESVERLPFFYSSSPSFPS